MSGGLIRNQKYLTQTGQLRSISRTKYGDISTISSIATVSCLVYVEGSGQNQATPAISNPVQHQLLLPYELRATIKTNDHISQVTDRFGVVVLEDARVSKIIDYNHWRYAERFFHCVLDLELDGI